MVKFLLFLFLWIKLITFSSATWEIIDSTDDPISCYTNRDDEYYDGLQNIFNANNDLVSKWLYDLARTKGQKNLFTSLYSLLLSVGQLAAYADELIRTELLNVIYLKNIDEVGRVLREVADRLNYNGEYNSTMSSLMTADEKYKFTDDFRRTYYATIYGKTANLNFKDSYTTANYLNDWMIQDTCHQDHDFVSSEQISTDLGVIITSFIHLTLNWENSFRPLKRVPIDFLEINNAVTLTDAWYFDGYTKYSDDEELNAKLIDILMLGDWRLRIVYPNNQGELFDIIRKLRNINTFKSAFANTELTRLRLTVPLKEDVYGYEDYVDIMKFADLTEIFDPNFNGFRRGFENGIGCNISLMFHKLHLTFANGLNTEKAAENSTAKYLDSDVISVNVNRPFLFYIICPSDTQVFAGAVYKPY